MTSEPEKYSNNEKRIIQGSLLSIVQWSPLGGTSFAFASLLLKQEWLAALALFPVTAVSAIWASYSRTFMKRLSEIYAERGKEDGEAFVNELAKLNDRLDSVIRFQLSGFKDKYLQCMAMISGDVFTEGLRIQEVFSPSLAEIFIPLELSTNQNNITIDRELQHDNTEIDSIVIWDLLEKIRQQPKFRHIAILGWGGSGKTTLLRHITYTYAKNLHRRYHAPKLVPILLNLRVWHDLIISDSSINLPELITKHYLLQLPMSRELSPPSKWAEYLLQFGEALIMLDGFDEVSQLKRDRLSQWIDKQIQQYPLSVFIITSRPLSYKDTITWTTLFIRPFSHKQIQQFIERWYLFKEQVAQGHSNKNTSNLQKIAKESADDFIRQIEQRSDLQAMVTNPVLLTIMIGFHRFKKNTPLRRVELYEEICNFQLSTRPGAKGIFTPISAHKSQQILQRVALEMMVQQCTTLLLQDLHNIIRDQLEKLSEEIAPQDFLRQITEVSGLLVEDKTGDYTFVHRIFQEYLAAQEIQYRQQENLLLEYAEDPWWKETILLYTSQTPNPSNFIHKLIQNGYLALAYDCLRELPQNLNSVLSKQLNQDSNRYQIESTLKNIISTINRFLRYQNLQDLLTASQHLQWLSSKESYLSLNIISILQALEPISSEIQIYNQSVSRASRLSALARANKLLQDTAQNIKMQKDIFDADNISQIIDQWQQIITQASGIEGHAIDDIPVSNPYVVGNPVTGELFVGREDILRQFEEFWGTSRHIQSIVLYGHRRMGKTSILRKLPERFGSDYIIDFNMQLFGHVNSTGELLHGLALALYDELPTSQQQDIDEPSETDFITKNPTTEFNRFLKKIAPLRNGKRFIVTIDEFEIIEELIKEGKLESRLIGYWRALIQTHSWFVIALAGLHTLNEMTSDYWSPLFGSIKTIPVSFLSPEAVTRLITNPSPDFNLTYDKSAIDFIYYLTSGQPYLVQLICHNLVSYFNRQRFEERLDREFRFTIQDVETVINMTNFYRDGNAYFNGVWEQAKESLTQTQILQSLIHKPLTFTDLVQQTNLDPEQIQIALKALDRHDVIHQQGDFYAYKIELMRRWLVSQQASKKES